MGKPEIRVIVVADASLSMLGVAQGVRVGINAYVADLADDERHDYRITLVTFAEDYTPICVNLPPGEVPKLTVDNYVVRGDKTALMDAVGRAIRDFNAVVVGPRPPVERVLFVLATDGGDNASIAYSPDEISKMVAECEARGWSFVHLAAGYDAKASSTGLGLRHIIEIAKHDLARREVFDGMGAATRAYADGDSSGDITDLIGRAVHQEQL
jgi:hypothetical protein